MNVRLPILALIVATAVTAAPRIAAEESDWLEPEEGVFAGYAGPDPYELVLRRALLEDDHYRQCQLVSLPSFAAEHAVYIRDDEAGHVTVVSRVLKQQMWPSIRGEVTDDRRGTADAITFDDLSKALVLQTLRAKVETKTASLDRKSADEVMNACKEVLLRTRYAAEPRRGNDGISYHAGHWISGTFLAGETWSPKAGTMVKDFVDMEDALAAYAESSPRERASLKAALVAKARKLVDRLKASPSPAPSKPASNPTGLRPAE